MTRINTTFPPGSGADNRLRKTRIYGCPEYFRAVKRIMKRGHGYVWRRVGLNTARNVVDYAWFAALSDRAECGVKTDADISRHILKSIK